MILTKSSKYPISIAKNSKPQVEIYLYPLESYFQLRIKIRKKYLNSWFLNIAKLTRHVNLQAEGEDISQLLSTLARSLAL